MISGTMNAVVEVMRWLERADPPWSDRHPPRIKPAD
jgi:hypothetical protein